MTLVKPGLDVVPLGPHRGFIEALWALYVEAGRPPLRGIADQSLEVPGPNLSPQAARAILCGATLSNRPRVSVLVVVLHACAEGSDLDTHALAQTVMDAWRAADTAEEERRGELVPSPGRSAQARAEARQGQSGAQVPPLSDVDEFVRIRKAVGERAPELIERSIEEQSGLRADAGVPLLSEEGWIPPQPLPLGDIQVRFCRTWERDDIAEAKSRCAHYWPEVPGGTPSSYSAAVSHYQSPGNFFNGRSFRLVGMEPSPSPVLTFAEGTYFEAFDTGEPLGFEAAKCYEETGGRTVSGPYRQWLADPFDLSRRCGVPGVNTLTIRRARRDITFYLHRRTGVATAGGTVHVVPAGEFQPSTTVGPMALDELDLRSTIIREYAEEFLGEADLQDPAEYNPRLRPHDYRRLKEAVRGGAAQLHYLGIGLYPLTWKPEILAVSVFDDRTFDKVFAGMVDSMFEGELVVTERLRKSRYSLPGKKGPYQGLPFTEDVVCQYRDSPATLPAARACLALAWRHREMLGIGPGR